MSVDLCVGNNADLYDAVFRVHGLPRTRTATLWSSEAAAPPYYSNLLLLDRGATPALVTEAAKIHTTRGHPLTFKDGFAVLDGTAHGFTELFSAAWIFRHAAAHAAPAPWQRMATPSQLAQWEAAWSVSSPTPNRNFPDNALRDPALAFFGRPSRDGFSAGCIVNLSAGCAGLSNVFGDDYAAAAACAASLAPGRPVVGYERGDDLLAAKSAGFAEAGALRIWVVG